MKKKKLITLLPLLILYACTPSIEACQGEENRHFILYKENNKVGAYNCKANKSIVPPKYDMLGICAGGVFDTILNDKHGLGLCRGGELFPPIYDDYIQFFTPRLAYGLKDGKIGVLSSYGETVIPIVYDNIRKTSNETAPIFQAELNNTMTYFNDKGEQLDANSAEIRRLVQEYAFWL